ncbi:MAG: TolB protein [Lentimonas sp.]|jgi:TolB protein
MILPSVFDLRLRSFRIIKYISIMRLSIRILLSFFAVFVLLMPCIAQEVRDIGEAVRKGEGRLAIAVLSSDSQVEQFARRAFSLHGGFVVTDTQAASFTFSLKPSSTNSVNLEIRSGQPLQTQLSREVYGSDFQNSVLRACDLAVEATLGEKGFFAGKLAFVGKQRGVSELYTSDLLFSRVRPLTSDRSLVTGPSWSPDGQQLLYTTYYKSGFPDIYKMDFSSGRKIPIATFKGTNTGGAVSPDGTRIAMSLSGSAGMEIYVSDITGKNVRRITNNRSLESSPAWSPDGRQLVFESDAAGKPQLYVVAADGGKMQRLPTNISSYCSEPSWNTVQTNLIAFTVAVRSGFQIAVYDMKTRQSRILTTESGSAMEPAWLNDGRHLVFTRRNNARTSLALLDTKTGQVKSLHQSSFGDASSASFVY